MTNPPNSHHLQTQASSTSDNIPVDTKVRKRWRRRRKDSTVVIINNEEDEINTEIMKKMEITKDDQSTISSTAKCPIFSMTFPRYTIDLSGVPKDESEHRRIRRVQNGIITKLVKPNSNDNDSLIEPGQQERAQIREKI